MSDSWLCLLEIFVMLATLEFLRKQRRIRSGPLIELAARTGLHYNPAPVNFLTAILETARWSGSRQPSLSGKFRNRMISVELIVNNESTSTDPPTGNWVHGYSSRVFTYMSLEVENAAGFAFELKEQNSPGAPVADGQKFNNGLNKVGGSVDPYMKLDFTQRARAMLTAGYPHSLASGMNELPYIRLEGSDLFCCQDGIFKDVEVQLTLLNLLCDLAELTEEMGNPVVELDMHSPTPA